MSGRADTGAALWAALGKRGPAGAWAGDLAREAGVTLRTAWTGYLLPLWQAGWVAVATLDRGRRHVSVRRAADAAPVVTPPRDVGGRRITTVRHPALAEYCVIDRTDGGGAPAVRWYRPARDGDRRIDGALGALTTAPGWRAALEAEEAARRAGAPVPVPTLLERIDTHLDAEAARSSEAPAPEASPQALAPAADAGRLPALLDAAERALADADTDMQRLEVRDQARALAQAAAVLRHRGVQVDASIVVARAERLIHEAHPAPDAATRGRMGGRGKKPVARATTFSGGHGDGPVPLPPGTPGGAYLPGSLIRDIRRAHRDVDGETFEAAVSAAREAGEPLTRRTLAALGRRAAAGRASATARARHAPGGTPPLPVPPAGGWPVLYADPPWVWTGGQSRGPARHYPTLSVEALCALPIVELGAVPGVLLLWTTGAHLPEALRVMGAWGYTYRALAWVWVRQGQHGRSYLGMGRWTRTGTELCLLGVRGRPARRADATAVRQVIRAPAPPDGGAWGAKPAEIYGRIEALLAGPYLELFARPAPDRPGWSAWGLEAGE